MDQTIIDFLNENWVTITAGFVILDALAGVLPDKYVKYIGAVRRIAGILRGGGVKK